MSDADDLSLLDGTKHYLGWLGDDPRRVVREAIEMLLREQVAETVVDSLQIVAPPHYLTGARPVEEGSTKVILVRAGLCVHFVAAVSAGEHAEVLQGVFSWVAVGLDSSGARKDRTWIDVGADAAGARDLLKSRLYEVG